MMYLISRVLFLSNEMRIVSKFKVEQNFFAYFIRKEHLNTEHNVHKGKNEGDMETMYD